ncbi:Tn3 family transposase [Streptomyces sp. NPDC096205]|uniref:Tn3 family transposase n=1 Tax=Streptomyces sp. NPDC096205 TaxID=3366081 RepID=UPI0037F9BFDD
MDTHGASVVGFAYTELLNFRLLPTLKNLGSMRLYRPHDDPPGWPALGGSLTQVIKWDLIAQQYDQMVKCPARIQVHVLLSSLVCCSTTSSPNRPGPSSCPMRTGVA